MFKDVIALDLGGTHFFKNYPTFYPQGSPGGPAPNLNNTESPIPNAAVTSKAVFTL